MRTSIAILTGSALLSLAACSVSSEGKETMEQETTSEMTMPDTTNLNDTTKFKFDFALANIPSPANAVQDLNRYGVDYDPSMLLNPGNASKHVSEFSRAVNLGMYNIDMSYAMLNNRGQDVLGYMKGLMVLSDGMGMRSALADMIGTRAEKNLDNRDSLFKILDEIFVKSDTYLRNNERVYSASLIFAGSWIESLYLISSISARAEDQHGKVKARRQLWEQRFYLKNLIGVLNDFKQHKECADLVEKLKVIHSEIVQVKQDDQMNDVTFNSISSKIAELRRFHAG